MFKLVGRRFLIAIPMLLIVSFLVFVLIDLAPGDVATTVAGDNPTPERIAEIRTQLHLDEPLVSRYGRWLGGAVHGDLGKSLSTTESVRGILLDRVSVTASLALVAVVIIVTVSLIGGVFTAINPGGWLDRGVTMLASIAIAIPPFWLALVLALLFAVNRTWFPAVGYVGLDQGLWQWLRHLILPAVALAAVPTAE